MRHQMTGDRAGARLFAYDKHLGSAQVAGVDEAGRGCLAGPLVAAGVLFDYERADPSTRAELAALDDSKRHTPDQREQLYRAVLGAASKVVVVSRSAGEIDRSGLHDTNLRALAVAMELVSTTECVRLSDGFSLPVGDLPHTALIRGDATSAAIAAASIVAKVTRDRYMRAIDETYSGWGFAQHFGYSTPEHRSAIEDLGITPIHRRSFNSVAYGRLTFTAGEPE